MCLFFFKNLYFKKNITFWHYIDETMGMANTEAMEFLLDKMKNTKTNYLGFGAGILPKQKFKQEGRCWN